MLKITVNNWDKFNPRKDLKKPSWFRLENSIFEDPDFFGFSAVERLAWIYILSLSSKKYSAEIFINAEHAEKIAGIPKRELKSAIDKLEELQIITVNVTATSRPRNDDVTFTNPTNERDGRDERDERDERTSSATVVKNFSPMVVDSKKPARTDLETFAYGIYPLKKGKSKGLDIAERQIHSFDDLANLTKAILKYSREVEVEKTPKKFIKHFSTFMGQWKDYLDENAGHSVTTESRDSDLFSQIPDEVPA